MSATKRSHDLQGAHAIGHARSREGGERWTGRAAASGEPLAPEYADATPAELDRTLRLAALASREGLSSSTRAAWLDAIAAGLVALGPTLSERAWLETGLPLARLDAERGRTCTQLAMFAALIREGSWVEARIDRGLPDRQPPRPDLRRMLIPIGPVVVFAASNFPLAFSAAGGDSAAAIAAGCPIVVKAHPSHPGTSELVGEVVLAAAREVGVPEGWFSLLHGRDHALGRGLVLHPCTRAVAFTGSQRGGRALMELAMQRPDPIPVYAELGAINPVVLLPAALERRGAALADAAAASITLGVGQFCTKPGLLIAIAGDALERFAARLDAELRGREPGVMLDDRLLADYRERLHERAVALDQPEPSAPARRAAALLLRCTAERFVAEPALHEELFGPTSLLVACRDADELLRVLDSLEGQLAAAIHADLDPDADLDLDAALVERVLPRLRERVGRVIVGGWPTGVEPCPAMQHGGPWPASSDARSTSVGTAALARFARPICYQDLPPALLPDELRDANPRGIWRMIDGQWTKDSP